VDWARALARRPRSSAVAKGLGPLGRRRTSRHAGSSRNDRSASLGLIAQQSKHRRTNRQNRALSRRIREAAECRRKNSRIFCAGSATVVEIHARLFFPAWISRRLAGLLHCCALLVLLTHLSGFCAALANI